MIFEELLELITEHDLVYALGIFTGVALYWSLRSVLAVVSHFSKPRQPLNEKNEDPAIEPADVPWWDR